MKFLVVDFYFKVRQLEYELLGKISQFREPRAQAVTSGIALPGKLSAAWEMLPGFSNSTPNRQEAIVIPVSRLELRQCSS